MRLLTRRRGTSNEDKRRKAAFVFRKMHHCTKGGGALDGSGLASPRATRTDAVWPKEPCTRETSSRQSVAGPPLHSTQRRSTRRRRAVEANSKHREAPLDRRRRAGADAALAI
jgi:hypothetical protein